MNFESLANELLLDLFEYLDGVHLFRAFHGLNARFIKLLLTYFRSYTLDFRFVSKIDFDIICQEYIPLVVDRITSLCLSDDDETPQQLNCFLSHHLTLRQFTCLKSLSLTHIRSDEMMKTMMHQLKYLSNLMHLHIIDCYFRPNYFRIIWLQPKLTDFKLQKLGQIDLRSTLQVVSLSLRNVTMLTTLKHLTSLEHLLKYTPYLRGLSLSVTLDYQPDQLSLIASSLKILNLSYESSFDKLENLLQHIPNLSHLKIKTKYIQLNGQIWEKIIRDYLLKLKTFQMMMEFDTNSNVNSEQQVDQILDSFRTSFWLVERQWFVQCHWDSLHNNKNYCLYTLPCSFEQYFRYVRTPFKSTCPDNDDHQSNDCISHLSTDPNSTTNRLSSQLFNIHHFDLTLPCSESFWLATSEFPRLTSISVQILNDTSVQSQLQSLLDRAPHLYSLRLYSKECNPCILLAEITNKSIRRLDLRSIFLCFNEETCMKLYSTSLGIQCEVLLIQVENRTNILSLINNMKNLRALYVHCSNCVQQSNSYYNPILLVDDLIKWLKESLPTTFTISSDEYFPNCIRLWIRH